MAWTSVRKSAVGRFSALLVLATVSCADPTPEANGDAAALGPAECEVSGYPCTWGEVPPELMDRSFALGEVAQRLLHGGGAPEDVAALLESVPSVVDVQLFDQRVCYRLEGSRPMWISPPWELDHHRPPSAVDVEPEDPGSTVGLLHDALRLARHLAPRPLEAAPARQAAAGEQGVAGDPGDGKRARVLAPFEWEFPEYGNNFARRIRVIRDYTKNAEGEVELRADLNQFDDNPGDPGANYQSVSGEVLLRGEVDVDDFLGWDEFNLVILATHGTRDPCPWIRKDQLPDRSTAEGYAEYMEAVPTRMQCPSIWAGRAKRDDFSLYPGVEVDVARLGARAPNEGLTPAEAAECIERIDAGEENPQSSSGQPCTWPVGP